MFILNMLSRRSYGNPKIYICDNIAYFNPQLFKEKKFQMNNTEKNINKQNGRSTLLCK